MSRPTSSSACSTVRPSGTSIARPSTLILGTLELEALGEGALALAHVRLEVAPEVPQQSLDRPGRRVGEGADGLALHLAGHVEQHVQVLGLAGAALDALDDLVDPSRPLATLGALAAGLVAEE